MTDQKTQPPEDESKSARCPHCGGTELFHGAHVGQVADSSDIGLTYKTGFLFTGTESLRADLCLACGTVVRFFVEEPGRKWV